MVRHSVEVIELVLALVVKPLLYVQLLKRKVDIRLYLLQKAIPKLKSL